MAPSAADGVATASRRARPRQLSERNRGPVALLARRAFMDARVRTIAFAYFFAFYSYIQPAGFRTAYPTLADRLGFARSFGGNAAIRLFFGYPYSIATVNGYSAWRVGGTLALAASVFGVLASVRALRAEEESGRLELVLVAPLTRRAVLSAALAAVGAQIVLLGVAETIGFVLAGLPVSGSAYLALATCTVAFAFAGIGALVSQLAPTRRGALQIGLAFAATMLLARAVADTAAGMAWLRWLTPLGWAEELRPLTGARPLVLLAPAGLTLLAVLASARLMMSRDIGTGLLRSRDDAKPRLRLLGSPTAAALRGELGTLVVWASALAIFAAVLGAVSSSISSAGISAALRNEIARLGSGSITSPTGYLAFVFIIFIVAICAFAATQIGAARQEEAGQQLEAMLAQPVSRTRWLGGRLALGAGGAGALAATCGLVTWAAASAAGVHLSFGDALEAAANCLPAALMFLGIGALVYGIAPRASAGIVYAALAASFLWYLVGALLAAPHWIVEFTPFAHIGYVPTQPFRVGDALAMVAIGAGCAAAGLALFRRRDLTPA